MTKEAVLMLKNLRQSFPLCCNCRHYDADRGDCAALPNLGLDMVNGEAVYLKRPYELRRDDSAELCGPRGHWFESSPKAASYLEIARAVRSTQK